MQVSGIEEKLTEATRQIRMLTEEKEEVVAMLNAQYSAQAELQEQMAAVRAKEAASRASAAAAHEELQSKVPFCVRYRRLVISLPQSQCPSGIHYAKVL